MQSSPIGGILHEAKMASKAPTVLGQALAGGPGVVAWGKHGPQYKLCFIPDVEQLEPVSQLNS